MSADLISGMLQVVSLLNVGEGPSVYSLNVSAATDGRYSINEILEAMVETDEDVRLAIRQTPNHWALQDDMSLSSALAHGDPLPVRVGEIGEVLIQRVSGGSFLPARGIRSRAQIEEYRANTGTSPNNVYGTLAHNVANSALAGFYDISEDSVIRFTGYAAKVRSAVLTRLLRIVYDGAMLSASAVLTSATAAFTTSDADTNARSLAIVETARTTLYPLASPILTYTNATTATLQDAQGTGGNIIGKRVTIARLGSPAAYLAGIVRGTRGRLWKEGDNTEKAPAFADKFMQDLEAIRGNVQSLPDQLREAA